MGGGQASSGHGQEFGRVGAATVRAPRAAFDAVLLDAFGTLVELEPPAPRLRAGLWEIARVDVGEAAAGRAFRAEIEHYLAHHLEGRDAGSLDALRADCAEVIRRSLGLPDGAHVAVREAMLGAIRFVAYPDAAPALAALRSCGMRLVVASNWDCSLDDALASAGLGGAVDAVVPSAKVGAAKPDTRLFAAALEEAGVSPGRAVHVGDSVEHDVEGARAAGVTAVLVRRVPGAGGPADTSGVLPGTAEIRSLAELPALLSASGWRR